MRSCENVNRCWSNLALLVDPNIIKFTFTRQKEASLVDKPCRCCPSYPSHTLLKGTHLQVNDRVYDCRNSAPPTLMPFGCQGRSVSLKRLGTPHILAKSDGILFHIDSVIVLGGIDRDRMLRPVFTCYGGHGYCIQQLDVPPMVNIDPKVSPYSYQNQVAHSMG